MKNPKVYIGVPVYGHMDSLFVQCLMRLQRDLKIASQLDLHIGDSLVSRARNQITANFLESDCTHLLFIDSDLVFSAEQISRLVKHDVDIVGGLYPKKREGEPQLVMNTLPNAEPTADGLMPVKYIGTGFMLVKRSVFEKMIAECPEIAYKADETERQEWDFWTVGIHRGTGRYLSEDWFFCQRALDLGLTVYADMSVLCKHHGMACYPLSYQEAILYGKNFPAGFMGFTSPETETSGGSPSEVLAVKGV